MRYAVRNYIFGLLLIPVILETSKNEEHLTDSVFSVIKYQRSRNSSAGIVTRPRNLGMVSLRNWGWIHVKGKTVSFLTAATPALGPTQHPASSTMGSECGRREKQRSQRSVVPKLRKVEYISSATRLQGVVASYEINFSQIYQ
jgi:hypothetical protein